jgi:hypothetical protein
MENFGRLQINILEDKVALNVNLKNYLKIGLILKKLLLKKLIKFIIINIIMIK